MAGVVSVCVAMLATTRIASARETSVFNVEIDLAPTFLSGYLRYKGQPYGTYDEFLPGWGFGGALRLRFAIDDENALGLEGRITIGFPFKHGEPQGLFDSRAYVLYERSFVPAGRWRLTGGAGIVNAAFAASESTIYIPGELHSAWGSMTGPAWMAGVLYDFAPRVDHAAVLGLRAHFGALQNGSEVYAPLMLSLDGTFRF